jgi:acyl carrier protein
VAKRATGNREVRSMSNDEIQSGLAEILQEVAGVDPAVVSPDKTFLDDLDVDSLSMVEVVVAAEEKFNIRIPDDDVKELRTVGDAVAYITRADVAA